MNGITQMMKEKGEIYWSEKNLRDQFPPAPGVWLIRLKPGPEDNPELCGDRTTGGLTTKSLTEIFASKGARYPGEWAQEILAGWFNEYRPRFWSSPLGWTQYASCAARYSDAEIETILATFNAGRVERFPVLVQIKNV